jgi:cyclophilin family peptidyl-prolyl cis-trans isomerase
MRRPPAKALLATALAAFLLLSASTAHARTVVRFATNLGAIDIELFDETMPDTVANFLNYVRSGNYTACIFHRSTTHNPAGIQIVQGGGFFLTGNSISPIPTASPIALEPSGPNLRGTIAMARTSDRNSATSQWYFNVTDNPALDGNYAVFGKILGPAGFTTLNAVGAVRAYNASVQLGDAFSELPLLQPALLTTNLVLVQSAQIIPPALRITGFEKTASGFRIDWTAEPPGRAVDIQRSTDLVSGPWTTLSTNNSNSTFTDTNPPEAKAFYRVSVP